MSAPEKKKKSFSKIALPIGIVLLTFFIGLLVTAFVLKAMWEEHKNPPVTIALYPNWTIFTVDPEKEWVEYQIITPSVKYRRVFNKDYENYQVLPLTNGVSNRKGEITSIAFCIDPGQKVKTAKLKFRRHNF